jgi:hypothetical protein
VVGLLLFVAAGFVLGWVLNHPAAWAVALVPVAFALVAGDDVDIVVAILGIALTALAVLAGRALARRRPLDEFAEPDEDDEPDEGDEGDNRDEGDNEGDERSS